jgi:hypothetical protein
MGQPRTAPFARLDLVQHALAILDSPDSGEDRRGLLEALLADAKEFEPDTQSVEWCTCGYPAARVTPDGPREPITDLLGLEPSSGKTTNYYCPSCDTRRTTVAG